MVRHFVEAQLSTESRNEDFVEWNGDGFSEEHQSRDGYTGDTVLRPGKSIHGHQYKSVMSTTNKGPLECFVLTGTNTRKIRGRLSETGE
jgi:hypothetical protein